MTRSDIARWWMIAGGALMVLVGGLALLDSNLVGSRADAILTMNPTHGAVHLIGGIFSIAAGLLFVGRRLANAALIYGTLFMTGFALNMISPDFWGHMDVPANGGVHVMHFAVGMLSLTAGYLALFEAAPGGFFSSPRAPKAPPAS